MTSGLDNFCWIFVCQSGTIEREACVLAATLRQQLGRSAKLVAAIPLPKTVMGTISVEAADFLRSLDVELAEFFNPLPKDSSQKIHLMMNKAYALTLAPDADVTVFLDSDQICHAPVNPANFATPFIGRRVSYRGARWMEGLWERAYQLCDAPMPLQRIVSHSGPPEHRTVQSPPYFNAGFLSVHRSWVQQLHAEYVDCFSRLWQHNLLGEARYYTEQVALTIAAAKMRIPYQIDAHWIDRSFLHYCTQERLMSLPDKVLLVRQLCEELPGLRAVLAADPGWSKLAATATDYDRQSR